MESYLDGADFSWEVVIVDDESTDGSREWLEAWLERKERTGWRLHTIAHGGKPAAVWAGIEAAVGDIVLFTDMDQSTPIEEWDKLRGHYDEGYDVVIGSRGRVRGGFNPLRRVGSEVFRGVRRGLILGDLEDTQCGFKMFTAAAADAIFSSVTVEGWAFDIEVLYIARRRGFRVREVPIEWHFRSESRVRMLPDSVAMLSFGPVVAAVLVTAGAGALFGRDSANTELPDDMPDGGVDPGGDRVHAPRVRPRPGGGVLRARGGGGAVR